MLWFHEKFRKSEVNPDMLSKWKRTHIFYLEVSVLLVEILSTKMKICHPELNNIFISLLPPWSKNVCFLKWRVGAGEGLTECALDPPRVLEEQAVTRGWLGLRFPVYNSWKLLPSVVLTHLPALQVTAMAGMPRCRSLWLSGFWIEYMLLILILLWEWQLVLWVT